MCMNSYNLPIDILISCLRSWQDGLRQCEDSPNRQPTLEDIPMFLQDSWIYAALISLPEGDSIIIMKNRVNMSETCHGLGNCTDTCQICDNRIVFNRSKASIKPQLGKMVPGKHYILHDYDFEDFPKPDICLEYLSEDKKLVFRHCNKTRPVQCLNVSSSTFETTACYQPSTFIPSCLDLSRQEHTHCDSTDNCTVAGLFQESNVYVVTLVGAAFIYGMFNIIFIMWYYNNFALFFKGKHSTFVQILFYQHRQATSLYILTVSSKKYNTIILLHWLKIQSHLKKMFLTIFRLNPIVLLMLKMTTKQGFFFICVIRAENRCPLNQIRRY